MSNSMPTPCVSCPLCSRCWVLQQHMQQQQQRSSLPHRTRSRCQQYMSACRKPYSSSCSSSSPAESCHTWAFHSCVTSSSRTRSSCQQHSSWMDNNSSRCSQVSRSSSSYRLVAAAAAAAPYSGRALPQRHAWLSCWASHRQSSEQQQRQQQRRIRTQHQQQQQQGTRSVAFRLAPCCVGSAKCAVCLIIWYGHVTDHHSLQWPNLRIEGVWLALAALGCCTSCH